MEQLGQPTPTSWNMHLGFLRWHMLVFALSLVWAADRSCSNVVLPDGSDPYTQAGLRIVTVGTIVRVPHHSIMHLKYTSKWYW